MRTQIKDIAYCFPLKTETNDELGSRNPAWNIDMVVQKTGIYTRYVVEDGETAVDLGQKAVERLALHNPGLLDQVDGLIFCSVTEDYQFPRNSYMLHERFKLPPAVFCLDIGMVCSGFVYALAVAHGLLHAGILKNIIVVTADTYTKCVSEKDRATKLLFSDGAAATWVSGSGSNAGLIDIDCGAFGKGFDATWVPAGRSRRPSSTDTSWEREDASGNIRTMEQLHMDGKRMLAMVGSLVPKQVRQLLQRNGLTSDDIDLFVFHQASKLVLDSLEKLLRLPPDKNFRNLKELGNMTSASIPVALKDALEGGMLKRGDRVVISGFGAGFSFGSAILEM